MFCATEGYVHEENRQFNHYNMSITHTSYMETPLAGLRHSTWTQRNVKRYKTKEKETKEIIHFTVKMEHLLSPCSLTQR